VERSGTPVAAARPLRRRKPMSAPRPSPLQPDAVTAAETRRFTSTVTAASPIGDMLGDGEGVDEVDGDACSDSVDVAETVDAADDEDSADAVCDR
jgi:hypothetical protein